MMDPIGQGLKSNFRITIIDLPGFGKSEEPIYGWNIYDYCDMLHIFIKQLNIAKPIIIGHSFGGRIAIIYSAHQEVDKLVLLAAPFKKSDNSKTIKTRLLKCASKLPLLNRVKDVAKKYIGSNDYRNASTIMREVLKNTVNEDLTKYAKMIKSPTLLIWGSADLQVPINDAIELEKLIEDCGLVVYDELGHYAYLENINQTMLILNKFLDLERGL